MPISKENKLKYPKNWKQISLNVRAKADNRCEFCDIKNHAIGYRTKKGEFIELEPSHQADIDVQENNLKLIKIVLQENNLKLIKIVLTVAHLDHNPENNEAENLKALCQKCHLNYDKKQHLKTRQKNKLKGQLSLLEVN